MVHVQIAATDNEGIVRGYGENVGIGTPLCHVLDVLYLVVFIEVGNGIVGIMVATDNDTPITQLCGIGQYTTLVQTTETLKRMCCWIVPLQCEGLP